MFLPLIGVLEQRTGDSTGASNLPEYWQVSPELWASAWKPHLDRVIELNANRSSQTLTEIGTLFGVESPKWKGGILAPNGKIYGIPALSISILKIDPITETTTTFGSFGTGSSKWWGGALAPNGKIYAIPHNSTSILVIDPSTDTIYTFGSFTGTNKWAGGVLAPNGKIYGMPFNSNTILVIDPSNDTATTIIAPSAGGSVTSSRWAGGVLAPNGKIYGISLLATNILQIDPVTNTASTFHTFGGLGKYNGGVLANSGTIYGMPNNAANYLKIDPSINAVSTFSTSSSRQTKGILAPNGYIYVSPGPNSTQQIRLDPRNDTVSTISTHLSTSGKDWEGTAIFKNKIFLIPASNRRVLKIELSLAANFGNKYELSAWTNYY